MSVDLRRQGGRRQANLNVAPAGPLPTQPSAVINPLQVDKALASDPGIGGIDPRAVGPYRLTGTERKRSLLLDLALKSLACLRSNYGFAGTLSVGPSGRPSIEITAGYLAPSWFQDCYVPYLDQPTATEQNAPGRPGPRGRGHRPRRTGGSGLGLPITRQLVEAHGATVTATSVPGRGTVFTIRLPSDPS